MSCAGGVVCAAATSASMVRSSACNACAHSDKTPLGRHGPYSSTTRARQRVCPAVAARSDFSGTDSLVIHSRLQKEVETGALDARLTAAKLASAIKGRS
eukprot:6186427-Pleurochrysis_carterae.AAC.5